MQLATRVAAAMILFAQAAHSGPPELVWPLDCEQGKTCYIEDYVDSDPGPDKTDFTCGLKTRDGHRGTDIVLQDFAMMDRGVDVLAAAPGTVAATRDGVEDMAVTATTREVTKGRECGNAVRIDHGDGWQTLYCHMRQGSVTVRSGDQVAAGDTLGLVGLSGLTNIPHLHISVLKDGKMVDPFQPNPPSGATCGALGDTLWATLPAHNRAGLFTAGMTTQVPDFADIKSGAARADTTRPDQPLVLYGHVFYAESGDILTLTTIGPQGVIFSKQILLKDPKKQLFRAYGRKAPPNGWPTGTYRGVVRLERKGTLIAWRHADITVTSQ
ncbi:MAG: M23 family metallopeptidase [Roseovarius sp.]|nr:M23 family metallopeptidase [Roseovarius sp.]